ncbi:DUF4258 domain-containing protein [Staphylothermus hellenicus]|uniref:BrnT family toxin n=1 Tax=Staphylothermus hellenicus (strain DSM 12710 / JCM 10830 / BK20S6-10-b1 / P8) TaxID=591019 RepID=D7DBC7_STAHD|nr:DUF4258 domain-containing protein [Staphylothermus hellenicus]ADI31474.1 hypothetical protein Shell_0342 [Staphylothermus hellenicus DSM 12710]
MNNYSREEFFWKIHISKHAMRRMKERKICLEDIYDTINDPYMYFYDSWNDLYLAVNIRGYAVVYAFHGNILEIVTVLGRREFKALLSKYGSSRYKHLS